MKSSSRTPTHVAHRGCPDSISWCWSGPRHAGASDGVESFVQGYLLATTATTCPSRPRLSARLVNERGREAGRPNLAKEEWAKEPLRTFRQTRVIYGKKAIAAAK